MGEDRGDGGPGVKGVGIWGLLMKKWAGDRVQMGGGKKLNFGHSKHKLSIIVII